MPSLFMRFWQFRQLLFLPYLWLTRSLLFMSWWKLSTCGSSKSSSWPPGRHCPHWWQETLSYIGEKEIVPLYTDLNFQNISKMRQLVLRNSFEKREVGSTATYLPPSQVNFMLSRLVTRQKSPNFHNFREMLVLILLPTIVFLMNSRSK